MSSAVRPPCNAGPGYGSPREAMAHGPREKLLFVKCISTTEAGQHPDMLATVDVDPDSARYCQIVGRLELPHTGDEVHHSGWNACSSCHSDPALRRTHLVLPCLNSSRIYAIDVSDPEHPKLDKSVEPEQMAQLGLSFPHTAHCLPEGKVMISTLGDEKGNAKGDFLLLDGRTFAPLGRWPADGQKAALFGYDFWYQPRQGLMVSTEWGEPNKIMQGFDLMHVEQGHYGHSVNIWDWNERKLLQNIFLEGAEGMVPFEVRFLHDPERTDAFVCTIVGSAIFHLWRDGRSPGPMKHELVISIPPKRVQDWMLEKMPALVTDILVSLDDRFLFLSCWLHGDVRQYDITEPSKPKLVGQCFIAGSVHTQSGVTVLEDKELQSQPEPCILKGRPIVGGPQMLQLSLDGKRLYVTNSLYSIWDKQFYPELLRDGSTMVQLDVDIASGGLSVNPNFRVDFARSEQLTKGPYLAHEMRYPGGDCTSDIWI